ncbi:MAG: 50S ribosomal protein L17 [bacterium]|nr:MAG: 50S ribosomal protein L17 [bacterium]
MRHRIDGRKLKRTAPHRKAMLANMATSLLKYERIQTTEAKAKELRRYVEPLITRSKVNSLHNKREILKKISDRKIVVKLFENIALRYTNRPGGYTRITHLARKRAGDNSRMVLIELVEEALYTDQSKGKSSKKTKTQAVKTDESTEKESPVETESLSSKENVVQEADKVEAKSSETERTESGEEKDKKEKESS